MLCHWQTSVLSGRLFCTDAKRNGLVLYLREMLGDSEQAPDLYKDLALLLKIAAKCYCKYLMLGQ